MNRWRMTVDVSGPWLNEELGFEERRDEVAVILGRSRWAKENYFIVELADELGHAESEDEFNMIWSDIYDQADEDRIWIKTRF